MSTWRGIVMSSAAAIAAHLLAISTMCAAELRPFPETQPLLVADKPGADGEYTVTAQPDGVMKAAFAPSKELSAGWHRIDAEFRTDALPPMAALEARVCSTDYRNLFSSQERFQAASEWSQLTIFFRLTEPVVPLFELSLPKGSPAGATARLRRIEVTPFPLTKGINLAPNVNFSVGRTGEFPACWSWRFHGDDGGYELVGAHALRSGAKAMHLTAAPKIVRTLQGVNLPLPKDGTITFSVWARTLTPGAILRLFLLGDNYKWSATKDFLPSETWTKFTISGDCPSERAAEFFWPRIDAAGTGALEVVGEAVIWKASEDQTASAWLAPVGRNLLHNAGFEFGMNGWYLNTFGSKDATHYAKLHNGEARVIDGDGVDGGAALLLTTASPSLVAFCTPTKQGEKFSLSLSLRAKKPGAKVKLFLIDTAWYFLCKEFDGIPVDEWKRVTWTATWDKNSKGKRVYTRIDVSGDSPVYIDNVQLEHGEPTDFESQPVSIGFLAPTSNIYDRGSAAAPILRVIPSKPLDGEVTVEVGASDAWGRPVFQKTVKAPGGSRSDTSVELPTATRGNFHVELSAKNAKGEVVGNARWRFAVIEPAPDTSAPGCYPMGIGYELHGRPLAEVAPDVAIMKRMGVELNRFFLGQVGDPRSQGGASILEAARQKGAILRKAGIESILCHYESPEILKEKFTGLEEFDEESLRVYADFLRPFVETLKDEFRQWEVSNEPNLWRVGSGPNQGKPTMPPHKYMAVLKTAYAVIKSVDPKLIVHAPCLNGIDTDYLKELMSLGMANYMDVFSFHPYRSSPDLPDTYADLLLLRKILDEGGFKGPMVNTEEYFGADLFDFHAADAETSRGYFLRGWEELPTAGRTIRNYIHHAAAGIPYCAFAPDGTLFCQGGADSTFTFDLLPAYAAAAKFLSRAGLGHPMKAGAAMRVFLFPKAEGGPLATIYAPETNFKGTISLKGNYTAFDIMGNPLPSDSPLPLASDPIYLKFSAGTAETAIEKALSESEVAGLGDPFIVSAALTAERRVTVTVLNKLNKPASGTVALTRLPDGWRQPERKADFSRLEPGQTGRVDFDIEAPSIKPLVDYPVEATVESEGKIVKTTTKIAPVFARRMADVKPDAHLDEWKDTEWMELGEDNLSADFNPELPHTGPQDLSARFACAWGDDFFALAVKVEDDVLTPPDSPLHAYAADSLQIYFDPQNDATATTTGYQPDDIVYSVSKVGDTPSAYLEKGSEQRYIGEANRSTGLDAEVKVAVRREGATTIYEVVFPSKVLPGAQFAPGKSFGFSLLINDNDGKGRKMGLTLSPKGTEPFNAPALFKKLILVDPK